LFLSLSTLYRSIHLINGIYNSTERVTQQFAFKLIAANKTHYNCLTVDYKKTTAHPSRLSRTFLLNGVGENANKAVNHE